MEKSWSRLGDRAIVRAFGGAPEEASARAIAAWRAISADPPWEVVDLVPAARSLTVILRDGTDPGARLHEMLDAEYAPDTAPAAEHVIETTYDGEDLGEVARLCDISPREVIRLHTAAVYTVAFVGFSPGFGYLRGLSPRLQVPRRESPRTRVPAGAVALAGGWTAVYPSETPGGWRLIGRARASPFDTVRGALLRPGDVVRFVES